MRTLSQAIRLVKMGAPLHPIMVHFTIALTSASLAFDALGFLFEISSLLAAGWWTLAASVLMTIFTVATGVTSRLRLPLEESETRSFLRAHMAVGPIFFGLLIMMAVWRGALWASGRDLSWLYLAGMAGVLLVMTAQGYLGGELVYRYGTEVEGAYRNLPVRTANTKPPSLALIEVPPFRASREGGPNVS